MVPFAETGQAAEKDSAIFIEIYGFVPSLFLAQGALATSEYDLINTIILRGAALARADKHAILSAVAAAHGNRYVFALHKRKEGGLTNPALAEFGQKLARSGPCVSKHDVDLLSAIGLNDRAILELVATAALGNMLCALADALNPSLDPELTSEPPPRLGPRNHLWNPNFGPYLQSEASIPTELASLLRDQYGFIPALFRSQALWPELVGAETKALELIVFNEDHLTRVQKESILLAVSAANLNTYGVALHRQVLSVLGESTDISDGIVDGLSSSCLRANDKALLTQILRFRGSDVGRFDSTGLIESGFSQQQILEGIVTTGLGAFFDTLQFGLGTPPDFPPRRVFSEKDLYPGGRDARLTFDAAVRPDPDADLVARVQAGETEAFEELVRRHMRRIFGILNGLFDNYDEAHEAAQEVFVKAFEHIGSFQGRSKFSTWLTSIAVNTGTEFLRQRKPMIPLDEAREEDFRPRRVMSWDEDPEMLFAAGQMKTLVRDAVLRLPQKYRVAVLLRDINQLSTEDAADALGLSVPALKARILRARLMLRESLAAHFLPSEKKNA